MYLESNERQNLDVQLWCDWWRRWRWRQQRQRNDVNGWIEQRQRRRRRHTTFPYLLIWELNLCDQRIREYSQHSRRKEIYDLYSRAVFYFMFRRPHTKRPPPSSTAHWNRITYKCSSAFKRRIKWESELHMVLKIIYRCCFLLLLLHCVQCTLDTLLRDKNHKIPYAFLVINSNFCCVEKRQVVYIHKLLPLCFVVVFVVGSVIGIVIIDSKS